MRSLLKRWGVWLAVFVLPVIILAGYLLIPLGKSRINEANYEKIQDGWSPEQVANLLGPYSYGFKGDSGYMNAFWENEENDHIIVTFSPDGVVYKLFAPSSVPWAERKERQIKRRIREIWR
jgi:hypothetical protein